MRLSLAIMFVVASGLACAIGGDGDDDDDGSSSNNSSGGSDESDDECDGDRGDGNLGDVCREDCDCASGYTCYTDDYSEQCCAKQLNDLENGAWGVDCDGVQGPPPAPS